MKITLINKYFHPDSSATSQLATDLAVHLAARGHSVKIVTSCQLYGDPAAALPRTEHCGDIRIRRLRASRFGRRHLSGRIVDYFTFHVRLLVHLLLELDRDTTVVCCTDPPLISIPAAVACKIRGARLVNWLQDLYPEVAARIQVLREDSLGTRLALRLRDWSLRCAERNVAVGRVMAAGLSGRVGEDSVSTIHNWSDTQSIRPLAAADNPLRQQWQLEQAFVVGYSGNLGKAHEHETLLAAASSLQARQDIVFLLIGGGEGMEKLAAAGTALGLGNLVFKPYQSRDQLKYSLSLPDVHLVVLKPALEGYIVPSKFYGAAAAGKPVIFIGSATGELATILADHDAGVTVAPGAGQHLADSILALADNKEYYQRLADNARLLIDRHYSMAASLEQWSALLEALSGQVREPKQETIA